MQWFLLFQFEKRQKCHIEATIQEKLNEKIEQNHVNQKKNFQFFQKKNDVSETSFVIFHVLTSLQNFIFYWHSCYQNGSISIYSEEEKEKKTNKFDSSNSNQLS